MFSSTLSLPILVEDTSLDLGCPMYFQLDSSKEYKFSLDYKLKENVENLFSKEQLSNLKENNIEIFNSNIKTQSIPILFK